MKNSLSPLVIALAASIASGCGGDDAGGGGTPADVSGTWSVSEACDSGASTFTVTATNLPTAMVEFGNFNDSFFLGTIATVSGRTLTLARQNPGGGATYVEGSGLVSADGNSIAWSYTLEFDASTDACTATFTKVPGL